MKFLPLSACVLMSASAALAQPSKTPQPNLQTVAQRKHRVLISISSLSGGYSFVSNLDFKAGPTAKYSSNTKVEWSGSEFLFKTDSGRTYMKSKADMAFKKSSSNRFTIKKKVTITESKGSFTTTTSKTVLVKRGVPAVF